MSKLNRKLPSLRTAEGSVASRTSSGETLRRLVNTCLLWEDECYMGGKSIADLIVATTPTVAAEEVADIAITAREKHKLRHVPLLLCRVMAQLPTHRHMVASTLERVIQRPDELSEYLAIYWKDGKTPISSQSKLGLARAFTKFNEYSLAKYNRDGEIKLRDVLFLCHAKPNDDNQAKLWKRLVNGELATPDTWEVSLSAGANKKETFYRLMKEKKLLALAFIRNLRNMRDVGISKQEVRGYAETLDVGRVLPYQFVTAARFVPEWEDVIEPLMLKALGEQRGMYGRTVLMVDVSGSMEWALSAKSQMSRMDAACGLAILLREVCEDVEICTFSQNLVTVPSRHGFALRDAIIGSQAHRSTYMGKAIKALHESGRGYDRLIVFTDQQSADAPSAPNGQGYIINVASNKHGVGYGQYHHINGFSESVVDYIQAVEN